MMTEEINQETNQDSNSVTSEEQKPVATEPVATEPVATEPVATEPVATEPVATEPAAPAPAATEPAAPAPAATEPPRDPNTIYVGKKRVMNYVLACMTVFQNGSDHVTIKARGKSISAAVDVAQILTRRFAQEVKVKNISISTEQVPNRDTPDQTSNVSSIEIEMGK